MFVYYSNLIKTLLWPKRAKEPEALLEPEMESKGHWNFHLCHLANMLIFHPKMVEFLSHVSVVVDFPTKSKASW